MLRAIIFDFDGLILDTETPEVHAWQQMFEEYGQQLDFDWVAFQVGRGAEQIVERPIDMLARLVPTLDKQEVEKEYRAKRMSDILAQDVRPGVEGLADEARREGLKLAVASSSYHEWVDTHLTRLGLFDRFDVVCCADDVKRAKPYPDLYQLALERLGIENTEAVALEDSANGARAAVDAGLKVVAIPNDVTKFLDLSHATAEVSSIEKLSIPMLRGLLEGGSEEGRGRGPDVL